MHHDVTHSARTFSLSDFDFALPPDLIAQHPAPQRSGSRLLDGTGATPVDRAFTDLPAQLRAGDLLILNDTKVMHARLFGNKPTGGKCELLIERILEGNQVAAHLRVSKKPPPGTRLQLVAAAGCDDRPCATVLGRWPDEHGALFRLTLTNDAGDDPCTLMARHGHVPLPPYITHADSAEDARRYQTVFASKLGAVAAPTAALHFDDAMLAQLDTMGVQRAYVTLHVGAGTFQPVKTENLAKHQMHSEWYHVPVATQQAIADCRARAGRVVAAGTTSVRALESWALQTNGVNGVNGVRAHNRCAVGDLTPMTVHDLTPLTVGDLTPLTPTPFTGDTRIFITPGFDFKVVDLLLTNFHLPKSTLMMLVSAFAGYGHVVALYQHAITQRYRFFSYGDAMLLQRQKPANA